MKTLIIYTSQTGFTKRYAEWIAARTKGDLLDLKDAKKKDAACFGSYDAIVYGGWAMAGNVAKAKWFLDKAPAWRGKRLAMFCVGGSPNGSPEVETALQKMLTDEQKQYISAFYCQGGINYEKMSAPSRMVLKMFAGALKKRKDATEEQKKMAEMISSTYDISDIKYIEPIIEYLGANDIQ